MAGECGGAVAGGAADVGVVAVDEGPAEALGLAEGGEGAKSFGVGEVGVLLTPEEFEPAEVAGEGGSGDAEADGDLGLGEAALGEAGDADESFADAGGGGGSRGLVHGFGGGSCVGRGIGGGKGCVCWGSCGIRGRQGASAGRTGDEGCA